MRRPGTERRDPTRITFISDERALLGLTFSGVLDLLDGAVVVPDVVWNAATDDLSRPGATTLVAWRQDAGGSVLIMHTSAGPAAPAPPGLPTFEHPEFGTLPISDVPRPFDLDGSTPTVVISEDRAFRSRLNDERRAFASALSTAEHLRGLEASRQLHSADAAIAAADRARRAASASGDVGGPGPPETQALVAHHISRSLSSGRVWLQV